MALDAAELNTENRAHLITVNVGAWRVETSTEVGRQDVQNALNAATLANQKFRATVSGIILVNKYNEEQLLYILNMLTIDEAQANRLTIKMGIKSIICDDLGSKTENSDSLGFHIVQRLDFIICHRLPTGAYVTRAVNSIGTNLLTWRHNFRMTNPNISIIAEADWPSEKTNKDGLVGSVENMKHFWLGINEWWMKNDFRVDMFRAFDERWISSVVDPEVGAHLGWWKRINNETDGPESLIEKIYCNKL